MTYDQLPLYLLALVAGATAMAVAGAPAAVIAVVFLALASPVVMMVMEHRRERVAARRGPRR